MKRFTTMVVLFLFAVLLLRPQTAFAGKDQSLDEIRAVTCAALKGSGNLGVEFYFTFVPCYEEAGNNRLMLYIASASDGYVTVEVGGRGFKAVKKLIANDIIPVEMSPGSAQAFSKGINGSIPPEQVYQDLAVHVKATVPVVVYGVTRFNYTSDSFMAIPVHTLGKEYVVASMADMSWMYGGLSLPSETAIVAAYDNTRVDFTLGGPSVTVSGGGMRPGQTKSFTMNKGDVWVIGNDANSKEGDVTGSVIKATKPVGVVSGNQCANVPTTLRWCDFVSEMELPTNTWGRFLQVPKYASRKNGYFMKVFAKEPNTKVFYNGSYWKTIQTVGGQEGKGWIYQRVDGTGNNILSLSADKPISATVWNTGQEDDGVSTDPFQMDVMPIEQYQKNVMFCTPGSRGGIGFTRNFLGVVFELDTVSQGMPKDLEFGTAVNGKISWRALSAVFGPSFSTKDIFIQKVNGKTYAFKECVLPSDNVYAMRCSKPFMCYSYGGSDYDSYGHPTSGALRVVSPDTVAPIVTYTTRCDGTVGVFENATVNDMPNDDSVRSNLGTILLDPDSSYNYTLDFDEFVSGTTRATKWRLNVDNPDNDAHALIIFTDRAGNQSCAEIDYRAIKITINPGIVDFGLMKKNKVATKDIVVKNEGTSKVTVSRLEFKAGGVGVFKFVPDLSQVLPFDLDAGATKTVTVQYTSSNDGEIEDSIGVGNDCIFRYRTLVKGKTGEPIINVSDVPFGSVVVGTSVKKAFQVSNDGNVKLTVSNQSGIQPAAGSPYTSTSDAVTTGSPLVLDLAGSASGNTKSYEVTFAPTAVGNFNATITFSSDAESVDSVCVISGTGIQPGLSSNLVDFGRRRIDGNKKYTGPYTTDVTNAAAKIVLSNSGTAPVRVKSAKVTRGNAANFNLPDLNQFNGLDIPAGESKSYDISFKPGAPAYDTLDITFENDANDGTVFQAYGVGVVPRIIIDNVTFAQLSLLGGNPVDTKKWRITNLSKTTTPAWEFYDSVEVTDITVGGAGDEIATGGQSTIGTQRMSMDKAALKLPISLKAGEVSTGYDAWYQPVNLGNNTATISTTSDAEAEQTSTWTGSATGGVLEYTVTIPDVSTCVGSSINIPVTITNTSKVALDMADITFRWQGTVSGDFTLPAKPALPIAPNASVVVNIVYTPSVQTPTTRYTLICEALPGPVVVNASFNATGEFYPSALNVAKNVKAGISKDGTTNFFRVPVSLGSEVNAGSVMALKATVSFDPKALFIRRTAAGSNQALITLNTADGAAKTWTVTSATVTTVSERLETIAVEMSGSTPLSGGTGKDLFYLEFQTLLAPTDVNLGQIVVDLKDVKAFKDQAGTDENKCVQIKPEPGFVVGTLVCAYDVTQVSTSAVTFGMRAASPNPVNDAGTRIEFGVGFEAPTRIDIINTNGEIVTTLVNETLKANVYTLNFVPVNLSSGSYIVRMISAGNTFTQQLQIVK
ncbi:MAG: choice-of-anchor D domain-containing protein [Candidatus Kapaibacterium sp.]